MILRANQLDALFACPSSVIHPDGMERTLPAEDGEALAATHCLSLMVQAKPFDMIGECDNRGVDRERVAALVAYGAKAWAEVRQHFSADKQVNRAIEFEATFQLIKARLDVLNAHAALFLHWFTGDMSDGYRHRMIGMAWLIWLRMGRPEGATIRAVTVFLRHQLTRVFKYTAEELAAWEGELRDAIYATGFRPGRVCVGCPLFATCPARRNLTEQVGTAFVLSNRDSAIKHLAGATEDNKDAPELIAALDDLTMLIRLAETELVVAKALVKDTIARVGPVKLSSGFSLVNRRIELRVIDPVKAFRVLRSHMSDADIMGAAKLSLPRLLASKAASYGRGEKATAKESLEEDLTQAGAVNVTAIYRLEELDLDKENERGSAPSESDAKPDQRTGRPDVGPPSSGGELSVGTSGGLQRQDSVEHESTGGDAQ